LSSAAATAIALVLYAALLAPLALAAWRERFAGPLGALMAVAMVTVAFLDTGTLQRNSLASTDVTGLLGGNALRGRCQEVFDALLQARVVLERPGPDGLVVNGAAWDQVPAELQDPILTCAQDVAGPGAEPIEVIRR
jgi:hypothetical protein